jgi:hypothetical protein
VVEQSLYEHSSSFSQGVLNFDEIEMNILQISPPHTATGSRKEKGKKLSMFLLSHGKRNRKLHTANNNQQQADT